MSVTSRVLSSAGFQIGINLTQRLIGIISTLILARLLTPNDFGVIAIIILSIHFVDVLSDAGSQQYIIQKNDADNHDLNTAWTFDIIIKCIATFVIWLSAPWLADFLQNPALTNAIRVVSLTIPIRALRNPGIILLAKNLSYQKIFKLNVWQKVLSFMSIMAVVIFEPSYWAVIAGNFTSAFVLCIGSYYLIAYRPRLTIARLHLQWSFTRWALLRGLTGFGRSQADMLIASKIFSPTILGGYHLLRDLALTPALSLIMPASEPLLAAISDAKKDKENLYYRIRLSIVALLTVIMPLSLFIFNESALITSVLLGDQWINQHNLLAFFSMMFFAFCLNGLLSDCFAALNKLRPLFYFDLISMLALVSLLLIFYTHDAEHFALIRGMTGLLITASLLIFLQRLIPLNLRRLFINTLPALSATFIAFFPLYLLPGELNGILSALVHLTIKTCLFFMVYGGMYIATLKLMQMLFAHNSLAEASHLVQQSTLMLKKLFKK